MTERSIPISLKRRIMNTNELSDIKLAADRMKRCGEESDADEICERKKAKVTQDCEDEMRLLETDEQPKRKRFQCRICFKSFSLIDEDSAKNHLTWSPVMCVACALTRRNVSYDNDDVCQDVDRDGASSHDGLPQLSLKADATACRRNDSRRTYLKDHSYVCITFRRFR